MIFKVRLKIWNAGSVITQINFLLLFICKENTVIIFISSRFYSSYFLMVKFSTIFYGIDSHLRIYKLLRNCPWLQQW